MEEQAGHGWIAATGSSSPGARTGGARPDGGVPARLQQRHGGREGRGARRVLRRARPGVPAARLFAATARAAGASRTARSAAGAEDALLRHRPADRGAAACWSARRWAAGSRCWWRSPGRSASRALLGIAAAPDFTETLMWEAMTPAERAQLAARRACCTCRATTASRSRSRAALIEDGRAPSAAAARRSRCAARCGCCTASATPTCRGRPRSASPRGSKREDVQVTLVKDGDHRLSRPADLALLGRTLAALLGPLLRRGWRVAPRDRSDSASGGRAPPGSCGSRPCGSPPRSSAPSGAWRRTRPANGTGSGGGDAEQAGGLGDHRRGFGRLVVGEVEHARAVCRAPAAWRRARRRRCRRDGCGRMRGPA